MSKYEVNEDTFAVVPKSSTKSIIYERDNTYIINEKVNKIMEDSCEYYGSTFKGRQDGSKSILKLTHKIPIIIEDSSELIFFPTSSPRIKDCSWISLNNIDYYERFNNGTKVVFKDGKELILDVSYGIFNNQVLRSSRLQLLINDRKKQKKQKNTKKTK